MSSFGFVPSIPLWAIALILLLIFVSLWFEIRKKIKFLIARLMAVLILGVALLGLMLRPFYERKTMEGIILLTPSYKKSQADSLLKLNSYLKLKRTKECDKAKGVDLIEDDFLEKRSDQVKVVLGEGLSSATLEIMAHQKFEFLPTEPEGITKLFLPSNVTENNEGSVRGVLTCNSDVRLRLIGPSGNEDSVLVKKGIHESFALSFLPKQPGKFIYELEIRKENTISKEPVPIHVAGELPLKILFIQKFPTAETKSLKNFLGERKYAVTVRYQVSKNAFGYEFVNSPESKIRNISHDLLASFDLLFIDVTSLHVLSQQEKSELKAATQHGLGIIVLQNEEPKNLSWLWPLKFKPTATDTIHISLGKKYTLPLAGFEADVQQNEINVALKVSSRFLSGYVRQGEGRIGFTTLQETYRIKLEGSEKDYSKIWSELISKTSRRKYSDQIKIITPFPVYQNEPLDVDIISPEPASLLSDSIPIALKEDLVIDDFWHARIWVGEPGWHELKTKNTMLHYFVAPDDSWKSLRAANRILETSKAITHQNLADSKSVERKDVPPFIFFLLFLVSAGFLWLAPKLG